MAMPAKQIAGNWQFYQWLNIQFSAAQPLHHFGIAMIKETAGLGVQACNCSHIFRA